MSTYSRIKLTNMALVAQFTNKMFINKTTFEMTFTYTEKQYLNQSYLCVTAMYENGAPYRNVTY